MLKITELAIKEFKTIINELNSPQAGIMVYLKSGSCCSGPAVGLDLTEAPAKPHSVQDYDGLKVFIDESAIETLSAATIDYFPHSDNPGFRLQWDKKNPAGGGCGCS